LQDRGPEHIRVAADRIFSEGFDKLFEASVSQNKHLAAGLWAESNAVG